MILAQQLRRAAVVGAVAELIIFMPLFLISRFEMTDTVLVYVPMFSVVLILEALHWPSLPLIEHLYHTHWMARLAARFSIARLLIHMATWLVVILQATAFALVAFLVMYIYDLLKTMKRASRPSI
jgi:predicted Zn-dependent protease